MPPARSPRLGPRENASQVARLFAVNGPIGQERTVRPLLAPARGLRAPGLDLGVIELPSRPSRMSLTVGGTRMSPVPWGRNDPLRGAVAVAMALSPPLGFPTTRFLQEMTFGMVLFTLLAQGTTVELGSSSSPASLLGMSLKTEWSDGLGRGLGEVAAIREGDSGRHLFDLHARSGLTTEQLIYAGRAAGWLVIPGLERACLAARPEARSRSPLP